MFTTTTLSEVLIIIILILANGILAMSEIAMISARQARLHQLADTGDKCAQAALKIKASPNEFLSTVQVGITLVGIFAGAYGGATISEELTEYLKHTPALAPYAGAIALGTVVVLISYLSLIAGELVPKRIALHAPEQIARFVALPMQALSQLARPLVVLLSSSTNFVLHPFGIKETLEQPVTEAEIQVLVEQATEAGVFEEAEQEMMASVLHLSERKVKSIMTPRTDVTWIDAGITNEEMLDLLHKSPHERFVVAEANLDQILGVVDSKTLMRRHLLGELIDMRALVVQPVYIPENFTVLEVLKRFRDTRKHLAIVMDEYGGLQGLVTREDIFEAIVGEVPTLGEKPKWQASVREDGSWLVDGQMPLEEFKKLFTIGTMPGEDEAAYHTVAGFVLYYLERIPSIGENFTWQELKFEILVMDRHRIDKLLISRTI